MIDGERGFYWVRSVETDQENTPVQYALWGGSKDPSGKRRARTVRAEQVKADKRKLERVLYPEWAK